MKANFNKLKVEVAFDEFEELDIAKQLGNYIHTHTSDIGVDDVARDIYHIDGDVEIPDEYVEPIKQIISDQGCYFIAAVKKAIIAELEKQ